MTEKEVQRTKYKYVLNSNLVIQGSANLSRENEPSGEGESLVGRKLAPFGDLVEREKPPQLKTKEQEYLRFIYIIHYRVKDKKKKQEKAVNMASGSEKNLLDVQIQEDLVYRPKTKETRLIYESLLSIVQRHMGDVSLEILRGAADEVLAILKTEDRNDSEKKIEIQCILDRMSDETFNQMVILTQQLVDYNAEGDQYNNQREMEMEVNFEPEEDEDQEEDDELEVKGGDQDDKEKEELKVQEQSDDEGDNGTEQTIIKPKDQLSFSDVDAFWLSRTLMEHFQDKMAEEQQELEKKLMSIIKLQNPRECERKLFALLGPEKYELVNLLIKNKNLIYFATRFNQCQNEKDRENLLSEMEQTKEGREILTIIQGGQSNDQELQKSLLKEAENLTKKYRAPTSEDMTDMLSKRVTDEILGNAKLAKQLDLENLAFQQGARLMANKKCMLPKGSQKISKIGYEEVIVPATVHKYKDEIKLIPIGDLPEWARPAFPSPITNLNFIQSKVYQSAFKSNENLLICAPTGAGKTNIALLTILQVLNMKRKTNGRFDIKNFKIIYIAPMKALVTEVVGNFQKRLDSFGITVKELTGDINLTKSQIDETQIIVTTPEKWDIITRKSGDRAFLELVKLIIIDEVHLLHDSRGPVLEAIVARTIRQIESTAENIRIVALSATLPNYHDVAAFLRVKPETGLHYFDNSFRPVPLEQIYVGITEKKAIKRMMLMNEVCYEKVMERAGKYQILVFVHSRKETARTAKIIRDMALAKDELQNFIGNQSLTKDLLDQESQNAQSQDLKDLLPYGLGIHHAGLSRKDRQQVEQLFAGGHLQVLVSTATLAWGVNLPAHTVIIKGTQIYSPEQGKWVELSPQDMLQMMGRAGRPQYDTRGEGIIITNYSELQYHLSLNNQQLPIESQLITQLPDQLNAEIVLGTVSNVKEAINWLGYSYLYIRMLRSPQLYGIDEQEIQKDPLLIQRRADLVHTAAILLQKASMIKYDKRTGSLQSTAIGKVASHYYIKHNSMSIYNENLKSYMNIIDVFRLFALSKEFQFIPIRENEKLELQKFIDKVPIPVKGAMDETATKINILLQAYISRFKMEGYDLNADMVYVTQSAGRILRCLFEICLRRGWAQLSEVLLNLCKMVERRQWSSMTPLRQYHGIPEDILRKIEKKEQFSWQHFYDMSAQQIGEIVKFPKMGKIIHKLVHQFPRLELEAYVQPITRTIIQVEIAIKADFQWEQKIHGRAEPFWILVQDSDSEQILHSEQFILKDREADEQHLITFTVPLYEPMPPQYFIKVISDRWLQSEHVLPVSFKHLILPERFPATTDVQDMHSKLVRELQFQEAEDLYIGEGIKEFNSIQTQTFNKVYQTDESVFIGAPSGSQIIVCAELAIFREIQKEDFKKIVYIAPNEQLCQIRYDSWKERLGTQIGLQIDKLSGTLQQDIQVLNQADIIISTPDKWDFLSRKWQLRKIDQKVGLYIFDQLQMIPEGGSVYEIIASRTRYIQNEGENKNIRIIGLGTPIANSKDVANWLGISFPQNTFNFHPSVRPVPLEIHIQGFDHNNRQTRALAMERPAYNVLKKNLNKNTDSQAIIFVNDRKQARLLALDLISFVASDENPNRFLQLNKEMNEADFQNLLKKKVQEHTLISSMEYGIGFLHDGMSNAEIAFIKQLYSQGIFRVLIVIYTFSWRISDLESHVVIILDAEKYNGEERRYVEYSIPDMLQMMGRANLTQTIQRGGPQLAAKCVLYCHTPKKEYFIKFLQEPLPIESQLDHHLHDHLNAAIAAGNIESKQDAVDWITWTFMYRRISQNPNYYNIAGKTGTHINDHLSELIETTVEDLQKAKCISVAEDEMGLEIANLGRIAAFYYIKYQTIDLFSKNLEDESTLNKKLKALIEILSQASEFEQVPIRQGEESLLRSLTSYLTYPIEVEDEQNYNSPANKTNLLIQCHFNRTNINVDLRIDQKVILQQAIKLIHAMVDVISSHGYLKPALLCMELSQMTVQSMWVTQSPLLQLPGFTQDTVEALKSAKVDDIIDFMNMDDDLRQKILKLSDKELQKLANVCTRYPNVEMEFETKEESYSDGDVAELIVTIRRPDIEEKEELAVFNQPVYAQYYPLEKEEQWWIVVGQPKQNKLLSIKKITNFKAQNQIQTELKFVIKNEGNSKQLEYKVYLICDSYIGCDQEDNLIIKLD
ncbi:u5 small nuclear ribonucleoprotein 200 kda helicase [Stylonychia lemnae]|uniref:U5 small nuclear ribonucleoprotein 200 kDa helicase n=1 Tax=Stylonychia lemnae TaxID=5949 RepID=A0A078AL71_STYLE|nr:u5 small nuclear ribonucleoprotein 200 kda helicase [Stylonychia lemnae]|eukprot:CDW82626.1 u5 small nuclear ribonucleoprotein 200 kda helicase [Stylonychia lemnae]